MRSFPSAFRAAIGAADLARFTKLVIFDFPATEELVLLSTERYVHRYAGATASEASRTYAASIVDPGTITEGRTANALQLALTTWTITIENTGPSRFSNKFLWAAFAAAGKDYTDVYVYLTAPELLEAITAVVMADKTLSVTEAELIRAICASLDCPLPPILVENSIV